jgi:hypothetical protein
MEAHGIHISNLARALGRILISSEQVMLLLE